MKNKKYNLALFTGLCSMLVSLSAFALDTSEIVDKMPTVLCSVEKNDYKTRSSETKNLTTSRESIGGGDVYYVREFTFNENPVNIVITVNDYLDTQKDVVHTNLSYIIKLSDNVTIVDRLNIKKSNTYNLPTINNAGDLYRVSCQIQ